jgi:Ca-activated chloride channel family protein
VLAGQDTRIRLVYLQPASVDTGIGRYVYPLEEGGVDEQKLAFWTANEAVTGRFNFDLQVKSAYPVDAVRVPNQGQARVVRQAPGEWTVHIGADQRTPVQPALAPAGNAVAVGPVADGGAVGQPGTAVYTLDSDIVVYWRHQAGLPGSVDLIANKPAGDRRGTFMLVVTPGDDLQPITEGRDWVFVLDVSGSMQGKYATLADGVQRTLKKFRPNDRFRIVMFNTGARELTSGFVNATPEMIQHYGQAVTQITPQNGTNLFEGLHQGLDSLDADRTSAIILVTDGVANVGETRQRKFLELIRKKDVRLFTAIMGNSANRPLLNALTRASGGFGISVSNSDDIVGQVLAMASKVTHEALHGVRLKIGGIRTADLTPQTSGSLYRGQQLVLFGHYWGDGPADITLEGRISGTEKTYRTQFDFPATANENPEIERLWAYARIEDLMAEMEDFGEEADRKQAVIDLGTEYGLVTDYTSMVVVREEVFDARGIRRSNRDRLATEYAARQQRAQRPAVSRRADTQQPMYRSNRPGFGGGALDGLSVLLLVPLAWLALRRRANAKAAGCRQ